MCQGWENQQPDKDKTENDEILRNNEKDEDENDLNLSNVSSLLPETSSEYSNEIMKLEPGLLRLACTNARSVVDKVDSLVTLFEECDLHFGLLTETWLTL